MRRRVPDATTTALLYQKTSQQQVQSSSLSEYLADVFHSSHSHAGFGHRTKSAAHENVPSFHVASLQTHQHQKFLLPLSLTLAKSLPISNKPLPSTSLPTPEESRLIQSEELWVDGIPRAISPLREYGRDRFLAECWCRRVAGPRLSPRLEVHGF